MGRYGHAGASGDMVGRFVPKSDSGDALELQLWPFVASHVGPHLPNIDYFEVYEGIWRLFKVHGGYLRYMKVYEGPPMVSGHSPLIAAPLQRCQQ